MIHWDVSRRKEQPLAPGSIHNVTGALRSGAGYPEHWRLLIEQAAEQEK